MASERVLDIAMRRHVLTSERPFQVVLDGIYGGISQPDIAALFVKLAASTSYEDFSELVRQAQGSAGLMRFLQLELDTALALDPQARQAGRRLVRLIAGNPVTMGQMTRHLPAAGSYAPVTILIQELLGGGTQVEYDTVASAIAPYGDAAASQVAERLDTEVLSLLHQATGMPATATAARVRGPAGNLHDRHRSDGRLRQQEMLADGQRRPWRWKAKPARAGRREQRAERRYSPMFWRSVARIRREPSESALQPNFGISTCVGCAGGENDNPAVYNQPRRAQGAEVVFVPGPASRRDVVEFLVQMRAPGSRCPVTGFRE